MQDGIVMQIDIRFEYITHEMRVGTSQIKREYVAIPLIS
jgi:hypothetical protein